MFDGIIVDATASGQGTAIQYAHWAKSVLMNGLGRYEDALAAAVVAASSTPELYIASWALSEQVEAATRTENADLALSALVRLADTHRDLRGRLGARPAGPFPRTGQRT